MRRALPGGMSGGPGGPGGGPGMPGFEEQAPGRNTGQYL
jgi:hypothetical protein